MSNSQSIPPFLTFAVGLVVGLLIAFGESTRAEAFNQQLVYIECVNKGTISRGSGVIISRIGHVLTARHVTARGQCKAAIGGGQTQTINLIRVKEK